MRIKLPAGLVESSRLSEPIFTPSTKAEIGHDENISEKKMAELIGADLTRTLKRPHPLYYKRAAQYAKSAAFIICDTNLENRE